MVFAEKTVELKNGVLGVLKTPECCHADEMLVYMKTVSGQTDYLSRYPEEWDNDKSRQEGYINFLRTSSDVLSIICFIGGQIVGNCEIKFNRGIKTRHRGVVFITVLQKYWGLGIGSAMFTELISTAKAHECEIIELDVVEGNQRAIELYKKFGFSVVASKPKALKLKDGTYCTELYMQKYLL